MNEQIIIVTTGHPIASLTALLILSRYNSSHLETSAIYFYELSAIIYLYN